MFEPVMKSGTAKGEQCPPVREDPSTSSWWADTRGAGADREQAEPSLMGMRWALLSHPTLGEPSLMGLRWVLLSHPALAEP